jgi:hypothetical protein
MAILKNSPFGEIRGKVGNFIIKRMNGKSFISQRPDKYPKSKDPQVLARRKKFANASAISSLLTKEPLMKELWKKQESYKKLMPYNKMLKYYYDYVSDSDIFHPIQLSPGFPEFTVELKNISYSENSLSVIFNPLGKEYYSFLVSKKAEYLQMFAVIKCKHTYEFFDKPFLLFSAKSNKVQISESDEFTLYHDFDNIDSRRLEELQSDRLILVLIALDENLNPVASSNTCDINLNWFPFNKNTSEK